MAAVALTHVDLRFVCLTFMPAMFARVAAIIGHVFLVYSVWLSQFIRHLVIYVWSDRLVST